MICKCLYSFYIPEEGYDIYWGHFFAIINPRALARLYLTAVDVPSVNYKIRNYFIARIGNSCAGNGAF
jgi:hypothetical protein